MATKTYLLSVVPPTLLLTSCRAARPYLRYLPTYLGTSPNYFSNCIQAHSIPLEKRERKLFICTTEFGSNSKNHGHDASVPHGFSRRSQATIHQDTQRVKQGSHLGFKPSREMHLTYLPTCLPYEEESQGKERTSSRRKEFFFFFFFFARSNNPTRRHNYIG